MSRPDLLNRSLSRRHGLLLRKEITNIATEMFRATMDTDADIQSYLSEIPKDIRNLVDLSKNDDNVSCDLKLKKLINDHKTVEIDQNCVKLTLSRSRGK